jgi:hypothetical protein
MQAIGGGKWQIPKEIDYMAEREGFEPSIELLTL